MKRRVDSLGRISIPKDLRKEAGIIDNSEVDIEIKDNKIIVSNPDGIRSREEIEEKIKRVTDEAIAGEVNDTIAGAFIAGLKWVINKED